ncbi:hypothetical protein TOPH_08461 [Tolypocladium ophioglossoides CBS 100239]|uniref:BZIP domain-containing protein n=1 Tax=Tolypocladium ophioglossoides (strain CBS 100239) TaxID=1163406 RepID=A0A0L0MYE1_TOLOC|nr:hypothetical protein TOPH_08461 [Tolypocladium ophioglossoides CBS 100239]
MSPSPSTTSGPYSLPDKDEMQLSAEDDWTRVKDRKEKKRIQNRVAQRSYRSRMKARLGELQSRLQYHEDQRAKEDSERQDLSPMSPPSPSNNGSLITPPSSNIHVAPLQEPDPSSTASSSPPTPPDVSSEMGATPQHAKTLGNFAPQQMDVASTESSPWFIDSSSLMQHGDPSSYAQPSIPTPSVTIPHTPNPMMSAFMPQCQRGAAEGTSNLSQSILQDCLRFQMQLLTKKNTPDNISVAQREELLSTMQNMVFSNASHIARANSYGGMSATDFPTVDDRLKLTPGQDVPNMPWKPMLQSYTSQLSPPSQMEISQMESLVNSKPPSMHDTPAPSHREATSEFFASNSTNSPSASTNQPPKSIDERIEAALEGLESLGFSNFDSFAEAYYSGNFDESSHLAAEQGMSRKRRLPRLLSEILDAAQSWDPWERRGLNEEVLRTAESLLVSEGKNIDDKSMEASISSFIQMADLAGTPQQSQSCPQSVATVKKTLQNELPNLWPLMMAVAGGNRAPRQRDRSNMVLASIVILHCSGRMPKQKLLELLDACI